LTVLNGLRQKIRQYPRIRTLLLPWWLRLVDLGWRVRKFLKRPVKYAAGATTVMLYPEGQIPEVLWKGNFESTERDFVAAYLRPGMKVVNVGANVGLYTVMASALVGPRGQVHAFEPSADSYSRLLRNLELNGCHNVTTRRAALSNVRGQLLLRVDPQHPSHDGHRFVEEVGAAGRALPSDEIVEAITLDDYMTEPTGYKLDLMVMDIEGAEFAVLQGAVEMLTRANPTILLECSKHQEDTENLLRQLGYKFWVWNVIERALVHTDFRQAARLGDVVIRREGWRAQL
jgi:FkbM family methyltransferase